VIAALFSGGKDSTLALHMASEDGVMPELLMTMRSVNEDSFMFHKPNIEFCPMQAEAMGIMHTFVDTEGVKEEELADLEGGLKQNRISVLITGAVASTYQRDRIDRICKNLGIRHIAPLWGIEPLKELNLLAERYDAIITRVAAEGMDVSYLGRKIDRPMIKKLIELNRRYGINMCFEGGEAESFVLNAPFFSKRILIEKHRIEKEGEFGTFIIEGARLIE
jgi:arCOG00187 universal archaeal metal-binding-domain/4Fe-4S-binding-domain containing ABC transporter, ATP-binding protein